MVKTRPRPGTLWSSPGKVLAHFGKDQAKSRHIFARLTWPSSEFVISCWEVPREAEPFAAHYCNFHIQDFRLFQIVPYYIRWCSSLQSLPLTLNACVTPQCICIREPKSINRTQYKAVPFVFLRTPCDFIGGDGTQCGSARRVCRHCAIR